MDEPNEGDMLKTLKILGVAAALVLLSGAVAFAADQVIGGSQTDDDATALEETDGRFCNETCVRTNEGDGEQVRTHTRTRTAWDENAAESDCDQLKIRDRTSWTEDDEATRTQTCTEGAAPVAPTAGGSSLGDGVCDGDGIPDRDGSCN